MALRLRQICLVANKLAPPVEDLTSIFGLSVCHIDPAVGVFGLENALLPVGSNFLEIVAPVKENTAAGRYLQRRRGDGGYMVITQTDDQAGHRRRAEALGIRIAHEMDYGDFRGMQLHPRDTGGAFFEIDWNEGFEQPGGPWHPAGSTWQDMPPSDIALEIVGVELQSPAPKELAEKWAAVADLTLSQPAADIFEMHLENAAVRFRPPRDDRGEGLSAIDIVVTDKQHVLEHARGRSRPMGEEAVDVCGVWFTLN